MYLEKVFVRMCNKRGSCHCISSATNNCTDLLISSFPFDFLAGCYLSIIISLLGWDVTLILKYCYFPTNILGHFQFVVCEVLEK